MANGLIMGAITFDQGSLFVVILGCLSIGCIIVSSVTQRRSRSAARPGELMKRQRADGLHNTLVLQEMRRCELCIISALLSAIGITLLLFTLGCVIVSLALTGKLMGLTTQGGDPVTSGLILCSVIGCGVGSVVGVLRARNVSKHATTYGDLRQRRITDYRSRIFPFIVGILIASIVALTWIIYPYLAPVLRFQLFDGGHIDIPNQLWLFAIVPIMMVLSVLVLEMFMARVVTQARFVFAPDAMEARRADDMLRGRVIGMMQGYQFWAISVLIQVQARLWVAGNYGSHPGWVDLLVVFTFFGAQALLFFGMFIHGFRGRLGGRVLGWWSSKKRETQDEWPVVNSSSK